MDGWIYTSVPPKPLAHTNRSFSVTADTSCSFEGGFPVNPFHLCFFSQGAKVCSVLERLP